MQTRSKRCPAPLPTVLLTVLISVVDLFCWGAIGRPVEAAVTVEPSSHKTEHRTEIDTSFRLVDKTGKTLTDLGIDPSMDPPQIGLNPQAIVAEQNVLLLFLQQSAVAQQSWLLFSLVSLGLLVLLTCLPRGSKGCSLVGIFFPGCALVFIFFAYDHWTQLASLQQQQHILKTILWHAAHQPDAPESLVQLGATVHVASVQMQTAIHVCLDVLVLAAIFLLRLAGKQQETQSALSSTQYT